MGSIATLTQTLEVSDVGDIVITTIEQDADAGDYVREIRVFGTATTGKAPSLVTLRLRSTTRQSLEVTAPASGF
ncbi:hypothetical protein [Bradyrhizobium sp. Leo121]|uniref:hypothetical protein n=1 Tax=Bradyrhizobium sp. Leo121 TaxID=1571195 RepID=UPI00102A3FEA|nr:hypothetical protein [Bradyrhizobium sp. Leo121]RZN24763.1 hypothetical protein CWO90_28390 [Bradyrhizobium sp. Leo121]